jgi:hypothetical protein
MEYSICLSEFRHDGFNALAFALEFTKLIVVTKVENNKLFYVNFKYLAARSCIKCRCFSHYSDSYNRHTSVLFK